MKRRILTFMLCICMVLQLMPAVGTVYAAGGYNPKRNDDFVIPAALRSNRVHAGIDSQWYSGRILLTKWG